ncbi:MAG: site-2 protease family protein, partial [Planctomycetota bacterium]
GGDAGDQALPPLRRDLEFYEGPAEPDGSPTYNIFDPVSGRYSKVGWAEAEVLRRLRGDATLAEVDAALRRETTVRASREDLQALCADAVRNNLTAAPPRPRADGFIRRWRAGQTNPLTWLLRNYLYFRVPLLRPHAFLGRWLPRVRVLASRWAFVLYAVLGVLGLLLLPGRLDRFLHSFPRFFNWEGAFAYAVALTGIKLIHEFSHAFVARSFGVRVRTMGIAFIVLWPVPYSDVTDAWRLRRRWQRFLIGFAGIAAELTVAAVSLFLWCVAAPGTVLRDVFFILCTSTLISTLVVNLNPAMRFDGYYLLADAWNVDNLRSRATAVARWWLRRALLGLRRPSPEPGLPRRRLVGMLVYAIYAWIYRFFLYLGIAVLVYYKFTKAVGVLLFAGEIWFFLMRPAIQEVRALVRLRDSLSFNPRSIVTGLVLAAVILWAALPLPRTLRLPALARAEMRQVLYAPRGGFVRALNVKPRTTVAAGETLLSIHDPDLETRRRVLAHEEAALRAELNALAESERDEDMGLQAQRLEELAKVTAQRAALHEAEAQCCLRAAVGGTVVRWDEDLREGMPVEEDRPLGVIETPGALRLVALVEERDLRHLQVGDRAWFVPTGEARRAPCRVEGISPLRGGDVTEFRSLTVAAGGPLDVRRDDRERLILTRTHYRVNLRLEENPAGLAPGRTGTLMADSRPRSYLVDGLRYVYMVLVRESSF